MHVTSLQLTVNHSLAPHSTVRLEKLTGSQPVKKFPAFYGTQMFITAFTSAQLSLSWARWINNNNNNTMKPRFFNCVVYSPYWQSNNNRPTHTVTRSFTQCEVTIPPAAALSKAGACGHRFLGLQVRIPPWTWLFVYLYVEVSVTGWSLGQRSTIECLCVCHWVLLGASITFCSYKDWADKVRKKEVGRKFRKPIIDTYNKLHIHPHK